MNAAKLERLQEYARRRNTSEPTPALETPIALDRHFTVSEVAKKWHMCPRTIRRMFGSVAGVMKLGTKKKTLYIPTRLLEEKHRELAG